MKILFFDINSIIPVSIDSGYIQVITDSRDIYGVYTKDSTRYVFKYNLDSEEFGVLFNDIEINFSDIRDVNHVGDVTGWYATEFKGFIYRPAPQEITVNYDPNVFHLIVKDNKTRLVTSGWLDPIQVGVDVGDLVNVEMTVRYKNIGPNNEDVVIQYGGVHVVEGNILIKN